MTVLFLLISLILAVLLAIVLAFRLLRLHRELKHVREFLLNKTAFTEPGQALPNERVRIFSENPILLQVSFRH